MQNLSIFDINISSKLTGIFEQLQSTLRKFDFSDIKEKELYSKVQSINPKQDIVLEDIEWLYEDYEKLSDVFDGLDSDFSFLDSELANYLKKIIYSRNIAKREKIVILISHIEKLIEECLDESFGKSGIKQEVKNAINSKLDKVTGANIGRCYILAITNIVFARTDAFNDEIDKRIPFRNHILHNGIYQYSDSEISQMYFVLQSFIKNILIGGWAIKYEAFD